MLYLPIVLVILLLLIKIGQWIKQQQKTQAMKKILETSLGKIYDSNFDFQSLLPELTIEFFNLPFMDQEIQILKNEFSAVADQNTLDSKKDEVCAICHDDYKIGELVTTIPVCNHDYHHDCL
jgi:hypothetical protein